MKLEEAIEELEMELVGWSPISHPNLRDAVKLGIEALKLHLENTRHLRKGHPFLLPGKTEE